MTTDQPAPVSTSAAVAPAGPVPTMTASRLGTPAHFVVGVAAGLRVAGKLDHAPPVERAVAAVLGWPVCALAGVDVQDASQFGLRAQSSVLFGRVHIAEVVAERGDAVAVNLLPAAHAPVELTFGPPARPFDARAPCEFFCGREWQEVRERRVTAGTSAERS